MMSGKYSRKSLGQNHHMDHVHPQKRTESKWMEFWKFLLEYYEFEQKKADTLKFIKENPMKSTVFLITLGMCAIPIAFFLMFILGSFIFTLMGFLIVEGSLLAIGGVFLGVVVFIFGSTGVAVSIMGIGGYKGIQMTGGVWTRVRKLLASLPIVRNLVLTSDKTE